MATKSTSSKSTASKSTSTSKTTSAAQKAADSSALASMNKVRAAQGFAPQTAVGVKAPGRPSTSINKSTNEVVDSKTGKVLAKGSSLSDALAKQNQITSGSTPTISGRPDLYGTTPLKGEGGSFYDPSTRTTVNPRAITDEERKQMEIGSLASFNKSQGLTYLDGPTFNSLKGLLKEDDLVRGPEGQIWLKQGLSLEDVQARGTTSTTTSPTPPMTDVTVDVPSTIDSQTYDSAFTMPTTTADIEKLIEQNQALQQDYIDSLGPSQEELALQQKIATVDEQIANYMASYDAGINAIEDEVIPMSFITGQQASLERRKDATIANLTRYQDILTKRLGIATDNRKTISEGKLAAVNFATSNISLALQIQEAISAQQDRVLARADKLKSGARDTLTSMLTMFQGIDYADLTPELQNSLNSLAAQAGVPSDLLMKGMEVVKNQMIQAALKKASSGSRSSEESEISKFRNDAADMILKLDSGTVSWGAAWDSLRAQYPSASNETIDAMLGGGANADGGYYGRANQHYDKVTGKYVQN